jgi:hypothetical protein
MTSYDDYNRRANRPFTAHEEEMIELLKPTVIERLKRLPQGTPMEVAAAICDSMLNFFAEPVETRKGGWPRFIAYVPDGTSEWERKIERCPDGLGDHAQPMMQRIRDLMEQYEADFVAFHATTPEDELLVCVLTMDLVFSRATCPMHEDYTLGRWKLEYLRPGHTKETEVGQ